MIDFMQMGLGFSISAMLICIADIICTLIQKRTDKPHNRLFLTIMGILFLNALNGCISSFAHSIRFEHETYFLFSKSFRYLYFITHNCLFPLFFVYALNVCGLSLLPRKKKLIASTLPFIIAEILSITNPLTKWIYYYDADRIFHRNYGEIIIYIVGGIYYTGAFAITFRCWRSVSQKRRAILLTSFLVAGTGVVLQMIFKEFRIEVLTEAVAFTGVLMVIENEDGRLEPLYDIYNRTALDMDLHTIFSYSEKTGIIIIKIKDTDMIARKLGAGKIIELYIKLSDFLKTCLPWHCIYLATQQCFILLIKEEKKTEEIFNKISKRLLDPFIVSDTEVYADAVVLYDTLGVNIKKPSDVFYITDTPIFIKGAEKIQDPHDTAYFLRRLQVEKAVSRGLEKGSFEVYYQPTFTTSGKLHGAEALLRMRDDTIGNIYPDEFIPVAEHLGLIDQIDDFVLRRVCEFLKTGIPASGGISYINVNLSVIECVKDDFIDRIEGVLAEYGVDKSNINFEITESAAVEDYSLLSKVIHHLKREGFHFSMDDFGTGYSNLQAAFSLGLDIIKIDKSILWAAEQNDIGRTILESNIGMIKKLGKEILVEGVETHSQVDLLRFLEADYLQGFYFSKPIRKSDFIQMINGNI